MSDPYLGEIRMFGGTFAPRRWALCNGQILPIAQNDALFALIGTRYGGDGQATFGLPNLQGRLPVHQGTGQGLTTRVIGEMAGQETIKITMATMPAHSHGVMTTTAAGSLSGPGPTALPATPTGSFCGDRALCRSRQQRLCPGADGRHQHRPDGRGRATR